MRSVRLSDGVTAYEVQGDSGPWVVLVHGIFTPMLTWDRLVPRLVEAGLRVLRYDVYGRGLSDRPAVAYDSALHVRQLRELLDVTGIRSTTLVGWSLGAATGVRFATEHPGRVERLALIAPALLLPRPPALALALRVPGFAPLIERSASLLTRIAAHTQLARPRSHPEYVRRMHEQYQVAELGPALASALAHFPWEYGRELPEHTMRLRTLLVWGRADPTVSFARAEAVARLFARVTWCVLERGRHAPHYDHAEEVARALLSFISPEV